MRVLRDRGELVADLAQRLTVYLQTAQVEVKLQRGAQQPQLPLDGAVGRAATYPLPEGSTR